MTDDALATPQDDVAAAEPSGREEIVVERIVPGGYGLARTARGVILVRGALPGERVLAAVQRRRGTLTGYTLEVLEPHSQRETRFLPPGADLPLAYDAQVAVKEEIVREALARVGKVEVEVQPLVRSPRELGYRTVAQYAVGRRGLAARAQGSRRLVPLPEDPLVAEPVAAAFSFLSGRALPAVTEIVLRGSLHENRCLVGLVGHRGAPFGRIARAIMRHDFAGVAWTETRDGGRFHGASRVVAGQGSLLEDFGGMLTTVSARSFAQVNPLAAGLLYRDAAALVAGGSRAVDLYSGSGVLAFHLAGRFDEVVAVEIAKDAVRRGESDARRLGLRNVAFRRGDARNVARYLPADLVAVNPPRAGIEAEVLSAIADAAPPRILYVSCDPPTWARDVGRLARAGYRVTHARPYDFYPYTHHVEVLSLLER